MYGAVNQEGKMNISDKLMAYEAVERFDDQIIDLFQELINSGMAYSLQGSYGRTAESLIREGFCSRPITTFSKAV